MKGRICCVCMWRKTYVTVTDTTNWPSANLVAAERLFPAIPPRSPTPKHLQARLVVSSR